MRKVDDGEKKEKRKEKKKKEKKEKKIMTFIVATTSLPAVDPLYDDRWNAARSCQNHLLCLGLDLVFDNKSIIFDCFTTLRCKKPIGYIVYRSQYKILNLCHFIFLSD